MREHGQFQSWHGIDCLLLALTCEGVVGREDLGGGKELIDPLRAL
jgi:hypothetical protein